MKVAISRRIRLVAIAGIVVVGAAAGVTAFRGELRRRVEAQLTKVSGFRVTVGSAWWHGAAVSAQQVRVYGAAPFEDEVLAHVERLEVRLGGRPGQSFWSPSEVNAEGVDVHYMMSGQADNLGMRRAVGGSRGGGGAPLLHVRHGKLRATIQPARGPRIGVHARDFSVDTSAEGDRSMTVEGLVLEVSGWATVELPAAVVKKDAGSPALTVAADGVALVIPGGGTLIDDLSLEGAWSGGALEMNLISHQPQSSTRLRAALKMDARGAQASLDASDLRLGALHAWLDRVGVAVDGAHADVHVIASFDAAEAQLPFEVDLKARGIDLQSPAIDRRPWRGLGIEAHATGSYSGQTGKIELRSGEVQALGAKLAIEGWTELGPMMAMRGNWTVHTPRNAPLTCPLLLGAQPDPVREALAGLRMAGRLGLSASLTFDSQSWEALALDFAFGPMCDIVAEPRVLSERLDVLRAKAPAHADDDLPLGPQHPNFAGIDGMPPHLPAAFVTAEDGRFFTHKGFDLEMIRRALAHDLETRAFAKGGSTITQQLAKNLFLTPSRTLARKLEEMVLAWRLDHLVDKRRLLELYLNIIELGPGVRGVKQAARFYFGKELAELRPIESAHLAALTPNPQGYARRFRDGRVDEGWLQRLYDLLGMMNRSGRLSRDDLSAARSGTLMLRKI